METQLTKKAPKPNFPIFNDSFLALCETVVNEVGVSGFKEYMHDKYPQYDTEVEQLIKIYVDTECK